MRENTFKLDKLWKTYSFPASMQDRLKPFISHPNAPELLHHIFVPLTLVSNVFQKELNTLILSLRTLMKGKELSLWKDSADHWRTNVSLIGGQSSYDQRGDLSAPRAPEQRGEGAVDIIRKQLDFTLVCVTHIVL